MGIFLLNYWSSLIFYDIPSRISRILWFGFGDAEDGQSPNKEAAIEEQKPSQAAAIDQDDNTLNAGAM
jgi:hypothetical protein